MERNVVHTDQAPRALGPYSQAITVGPFVFASGQLGLTPAGEMAGEGVQEQTRQALQNLAAVLEAAGSALEQVVKTTVFLADMQDFAVVNEIYAEFFRTNPPARSAVQVARLPKDGKVEIEAIAQMKA